MHFPLPEDGSGKSQPAEPMRSDPKLLQKLREQRIENPTQIHAASWCEAQSYENWPFKPVMMTRQISITLDPYTSNRFRPTVSIVHRHDSATQEVH